MSQSFTSWLCQLERAYPEATWRWLLQALRHDPLVWESLISGLGSKVLAQTSPAPEHLSPASLALLELGISVPPSSLRAEPMQPVELPEEGHASSALAAAGRQALLLRERRRLVGSWAGLQSELRGLSPTAMACLVGMVPDLSELVTALLTHPLDAERIEQDAHTIQHAILSNPLTLDERLSLLRALLKHLPPSVGLNLLAELARFDQELSQKLAGELIPDLVTGWNRPYVPVVASLERLPAHQGKIQALCIAQQWAEIPASCEETLSDLRKIQAIIIAHSAWALGEQGDQQGALTDWDRACQLDPHSAALRGWSALAHLDAGMTADAQVILTNTELGDNHPALHLARSLLAFRRDRLEESREEAGRALYWLEHNLGHREPVLPGELLLPARLAAWLLDLNLTTQAVRAARLATQRMPNDADLQALLGRACFASGDLTEAILAAHLAASLAPSRTELRRELAEFLEIAGEWQAALFEREMVISKLTSPDADDLHALCVCVLKAGEPERALQISQQLLQLKPDDGMALARLGEAQAACGDDESALNNLQRAVQLSPSQALPWLALANFQRKHAQLQKALETLRAATYAAPNDASIHLALGEAYLESGSPTQALDDLRMAAHLIEKYAVQSPSTTSAHQQTHLRRRIALLLGQTLLELGLLAEARQVLENAYHQAPADVKIARLYAHLLVTEGELQGALAPLETVLQSKPAEIAPYLDYATCLLSLHQQETSDVPLESALLALEQALVIEPYNAQAATMLGEALLACGRAEEAKVAFNRALQTEPSEDPHWCMRLSLGVGQTALKLGETETAVAALREASQIDPLNVKVQRSLSQAYLQAGLNEDAFQAARAALLLAPGDIENLIWFAEQVSTMLDQPGVADTDAQREAMTALQRATQIAPERADLVVKLGEALLKFGDPQAAHQVLIQLADQTRSASLLTGRSKDYAAAAQRLLQLGDPGSAATCLERALEIQAAEGGQSAVELLTQLAHARLLAGNPQRALEAIEQALGETPEEASLYLIKADLLSEMQQTAAAVSDGQSADRYDHEILDCLEKALKLKPDDPLLHWRVAQIYRLMGDLHTALKHAESMLEICDESRSHALQLRGRALAAELALATLQMERARELLQIELPIAPAPDAAKETEAAEYRCLRAEFQLEDGETYWAATELASALEAIPDNPIVLALQARLAYRRKDLEAALKFLDVGLRLVDDLVRAKPNALRALSQAALELRQWEKSRQLAEALIRKSPQEPYSHLNLARILTRQAESQRLYQALQALRHAPGEQSLSEAARLSCETSLRRAEELLKHYGVETINSTNSLISYWRARAHAAFLQDAASAAMLAELPSDPEVVAAQIAVFSRLGELTQAGHLARQYSKNPLVLLQLAIALADEKPRQAIAAAHAATEALTEGLGQAEACQPTDLAPLTQALLSRLFYQNGNRAADQLSALQAIQNALAAWPDEPRWHLLAAEIYLGRGQPNDLVDREAAIYHLEQAILLDAAYASPYKKLGQILLEDAAAEKATQALEQATRITPQDADLWSLLARAYRTLGKLDQAASSAERAIQLSPEVALLVLRGEIALDAGDAQEAHGWAVSALEVDADEPEALLLMARALQALKRPGEALEVLEKAMQFVSQPIPLQLERVRLLQQTQGEEAAYQAIQEMNGKYPDEPRILALMAEILAGAEEKGGAVRVAQRALRMNTENPLLSSKEQAGLHLILGKLFREGGQLDQAIAHLNEALRMAPEMAEGYLELGQAHKERRQFLQALDVYRKAMQAAPHDYRPYYEIGLTYRDSKDYVQAERMLRRAAELAPHEPAVHRALAAVVALNLVQRHQQPAADTPL